MSGDSNNSLPVWSPRLRKLQLQRLYHSCGQGLLDEALVDEVGFALYSRCLSMLQASAAIRGNPPCPSCGNTAQIDASPNPFARCAHCGWRCPWDAYQKTYQRKGLFAGGLEPFVKDFIDQFPVTTAHAKRMVLIDTLIHRFHWESAGVDDGRPGATSLIEGKMKDIMEFLDRLTYGENVPPEIEQTREEWRKKWGKNAWSSSMGQGHVAADAGE